jgi:hypothetical protein
VTLIAAIALVGALAVFCIVVAVGRQWAER